MTTSDVPLSETCEFHGKRHPYALIVGVYNEGDKITRQLTILQQWRSQIDIIIADGNSADSATTPETLRYQVRALLINKDPKRGLSVQYRIALHYALSQNYLGVIMMDGNCKDGADAIPRFIEKLAEGYDFVQGSRFMTGGKHENTPLIRVIGIRFVFNPLMYFASRFYYSDAMNGFKACSAAFLTHKRVQPFRDIFRHYNLQYYLNYIAPRLGVRVVEIPVSRIYLTDGTPHSKIVGLRAYAKIIRELLSTISGCYNLPPVRKIRTSRQEFPAIETPDTNAFQALAAHTHRR